MSHSASMSPLKATVHTPGPWEVKDGVLKCTGPYGKFLFRLVESPGTGSEAEPNARLIAAAPDMLAALKELAVRYDPHFPSGPLDRALAAIAKAEGRAP